MTVQQLINALSNQKPDAEVMIKVKQSNQNTGHLLNIKSTIERDGYEFWITHGNGDSIITIHLPDGAYLAKMPK